MKQKKYDEAIASCQLYLQSNQRDEDGWIILARAYQQTQENSILRKLLQRKSFSWMTR